MPSLSDLRWQLDRRLCRLIESEAAVRHWQQTWIEQATQAQRQEIESADRRYEQRMREARDQYDHALSDLSHRAQALRKSGGAAWAGWDDPSWKSWRPVTGQASGGMSQTPDGSVRIGWLRTRGPWHEFRLPAIVPLLGSHHLFFRAPESVREGCCIAIQAAVLRLVASLRPGQLRLVIVDPGEFASRWAPFLRLGKFDPAMVGAKILSQPDEVAQRIAELAERVRSEHSLDPKGESGDPGVRAAATPSSPFTLVVISGFPPSFSETTARELSLIAAHGPRNGISLIGVLPAEQPLPAGLSSSDLEAATEILTWDGSRFIWQRDLAQAGVVDLDPLPETALRDRIIDEVAQAASEVFRVGISFDSLTPAMGGWATAAADQGLEAAIGAGSGGFAQNMRLGAGAARHALVVGGSERARAGLLNVLITGLALNYRPNELWLYLVSLRRTSGFDAYATRKLPHARVVAVDAGREYALSVLQAVARLSAARAQASTQDGAVASDAPAGPRHLVVLDDLEQLLLPEDESSKQAAELVRSLTAAGPEHRVHLVLASESPSAIAPSLPLPGTSWRRLVLPCAESEAALVLDGDATPALAQLGAGDLLYNDAGGISYGNRRVRVATLTEDARSRILQGILKKMEGHPEIEPAPLMYHNPRMAADLGSNTQFMQRLLAAPSQDAADVFSPTVWLGEPPVLADPVATVFARQSANNLLVITQERGQATGLLAAAALGLAPQAAAVLFLQLDRLTGPGTETMGRIARLFPKVVRLVAPDDVPTVLAEQLAAIQTRMSLEYALAAQRQGQPQDDRATFLILYGLQALVSEDAGIVGAAEQALDSVMSLLREGPDIGIHSLAWCDRLFSLNSVLGWQALRHFSMRAVGQLVAEDSETLIEASDAERLAPNQMLLFDKRTGRCERFKPYALPAVAWIDDLERRLAARVER